MFLFSLLCNKFYHDLAMKGGDCPLAEVDCPFKVYFVAMQEHTQTSRTVFGVPCPDPGQVFHGTQTERREKCRYCLTAGSSPWKAKQLTPR